MPYTVQVTEHAMQRAAERFALLGAPEIEADVLAAIRSGLIEPQPASGRYPNSLFAWSADSECIYVLRVCADAFHVITVVGRDYIRHAQPRIAAAA